MASCPDDERRRLESTGSRNFFHFFPKRTIGLWFHAKNRRSVPPAAIGAFHGEPRLIIFNRRR